MFAYGELTRTSTGTLHVRHGCERRKGPARGPLGMKTRTLRLVGACLCSYRRRSRPNETPLPVGCDNADLFCTSTSQPHLPWGASAERVSAAPLCAGGRRCERCCVIASPLGGAGADRAKHCVSSCMGPSSRGPTDGVGASAGVCKHAGAASLRSWPGRLGQFDEQQAEGLPRQPGMGCTTGRDRSGRHRAQGHCHRW